jgi:lipid-A-disaccharide synthase-like uncharacterized protein
VSRGAAATVLLLAAVALLAAGVAAAEEPSRRLELRLKPLPPGVRAVALESDGAGRSVVVLVHTDGTEERVSPEDLAARLLDEGRPRGFLYRLLNITSPAGILWVGLGFLGQILFTGRMLVQWFVSERERRSVVPVGFWWMSLVGASMLLLYFVWRRDIVGVLGQSAGWVVYGRNLWLIYRERREAGAPSPNA